tara:strand:- start:601 stop:804 length:204 start_codon:yes stop_codon:yes gene_type:complete
MLGTTLTRRINMTSKEIMKEFNDTHHSAESQIVHNYMVWVNNLTNEPCVNNPCSVCIRMNKAGLEAS